MDSEPDRELEVIKGQLDQTRSSLAEKIGALETQVSETVAGVTSAVSTVTDTVAGVSAAVSGVTDKVTGTVQSLSESVTGTVQSLTSSVSGTVESVKQTLDVSSKVQDAPWTSVGVAVAVGFVGGYMLTGSRPGRSSGVSQMLGFGRAEGAPPPAQPASYYSPPAPAAHQPRDAGGTTYDALNDTFGEITGALRSLGISAVMGVVSNLAKDIVPEAVQGDVCGALDKLKTKLGGRHDVSPDFLTKQ